MQTLIKRYGNWALVTGASSGLGEQFARQLAEQGMNVALLARRSERLESLGQALKQEYGVQYRSVVVDLNRADFLDAVIEQIGDLDIGMLVNNAGFANHNDFLDSDIEAEERLVNVSCRAVTMLAHHYGRQMRERKRGAIIFTSSVVGFTRFSIWGAYAASKSYDLLLAETLASELKPHHVDVMALCPGSTQTEFVNFDGIWTKFLMMKADDVVRIALKNVGRKTVCVTGLINQISVFLFRFVPRSVAAKLVSFFVKDMAS